MIVCGKCKGKHDNVTEVRECYGGTDKVVQVLPSTAKPKVDTELLEYLKDQTSNEFAQSLIRFHWMRGYLTEKQVAAAEHIRSNYTTDVGRDAPEGVHLLEGTIYKVQVAVHGSGYKYVKMFNEETKKFSKSERPGILGCLSEDTLMSYNDAARFGKLYGLCIVCGRTLTDENSIAAGIGPICAEKVSSY